MISLTYLQEKYANSDKVELNTNLKQNTREDIKTYSSSGFKIIPLKQHSKKPVLHGWTEKESIPFDELKGYFDGSHNYGLRLDYRFQDGNYLVSVDIEDVCPEVLLKHFKETLHLNTSDLPWTKTQSGALHLYLKTDRELRPVKVKARENNDIIVELRTGRVNQNVLGPSKYADEDSGELREYITYGSLMDAPYVSSDLIIAAFSELGESVDMFSKPNSGIKVQDNNLISFRTAQDEELDLITSAIELLRTKRLSREEWINIGFALISRFGKGAKLYFMHLSRNSNFPEDTEEAISRQFQNLLKTNRGKFTISTLFHIAKSYGFNYSGELKLEDEAVVPQGGTPIPFDKELEEQFKFDDERDPNKLLGFPLTKFKELAKNVDGIQPGFYLLGAESNIGKTAVLTNMCLDVMETNPEVSVIYFSLDDSRKYTAYRFLSIMTQFHINEVRKRLDDPAKKAILDGQRKCLIDLVRSRRLIVKDIAEVSHIEDLVSVIEAFPGMDKLVVFIDGLYNLEVGDKFKGGIREENIERARQIKALVDTFRIPILTTGELRKKSKEEGKDKAPTVHDLMETGKFAYNANVVWMLYGKSEDLKSDEPTLTLEFVKNKLSDFKGIQYLSFRRATGTMREVPAILTDLQPRKPLFEDGGGLE